MSRIRELEARNKQLSELLAVAVNELWDYQRSVVEGDDHSQDERSVEKLSAAIAKVQYIQVYLEQPSLQLAESPLQVSKRRDNMNVMTSATAPDESGSSVGMSSVEPQQLHSADELRDVDQPAVSVVGRGHALLTVSH